MLRIEKGLLCTVVVILVNGHALIHAFENKSRFVIGVDYATPGNIEDAAEKVSTDNSDLVTLIGGSPTASEDSDPGVGLRLSYMMPVQSSQDTRWGLSVSIMNGPNATSTVNDSVPPPGAIKSEFENTYIRALLEAAKYFPMSETGAFKLGAGIGMGEGKTEQKYKGSGYYAGPDVSFSKKSQGFTWEISPAFVFQRGSTEMEFGLRYAQFPKIKESEDTYEVKYSGLGAYVALGF